MTQQQDLGLYSDKMEDRYGNEVNGKLLEEVTKKGTPSAQIFKLNKPSELFDHVDDMEKWYPEGIKISGSEENLQVYGFYHDKAVVYADVPKEQLDAVKRIASGGENLEDYLTLFSAKWVEPIGFVSESDYEGETK